MTVLHPPKALILPIQTLFPRDNTHADPSSDKSHHSPILLTYTYRHKRFSVPPQLRLHPDNLKSVAWTPDDFRPIPFARAVR